jgi:hypothetical protein
MLCLLLLNMSVRTAHCAVIAVAHLLSVYVSHFCKTLHFTLYPHVCMLMGNLVF